jgi:hypothetical protein
MATQWGAPHIDSLNCFFKAVAVSDRGYRSEAFSRRFSISIIEDTIPEDSVEIPEDSLPPDNGYTLQVVPVDQHTVQIIWESDSSNSDVNSVSIRFNELHYPQTATDSLSEEVGIFSPSDSSCILSNLQSNTGYFFALFVADSAGNWSEATSASRVKIITPSDTLEKNDIGVPVTIGQDTVKLFGDSLRVWSATKLQIPYYDTIDQWEGPTIKDGFEVAGTGYSFRKGALPPNTAVYLQMAYNKNSDDLNTSNIRVYNYNVYTGNWRLNRDTAELNTDKGTITIKCDNISFPFIVMIDTLVPDVAGHFQNREYYSAGQQIVDTFFVEDNIENTQGKLFINTGDKAPIEYTYYLDEVTTSKKYISRIPVYLEHLETGIRGYFIADDGINFDSTNLSRQILRSKNTYDDTVTRADSWVPLFVTAKPVKPFISNALGTSGDTTPYSGYDSKNELIIQWLPTKQNAEKDDQWIEYSTKTDSLFRFEPGKLFWIKTAETKTIQFGKSVLPALKDTFSIPLYADNWTDFTNPYNFDILLKEVMRSNNKSAIGTTDSLELYKWVFNGSRYITKSINIPGISEIDTASDTIKARGVYTVYNSKSRSGTLKLPPTCIEMSEQGNPGILEKRRISAGRWFVKIGVLIDDTLEQPSIYCASEPAGGQPRYYAMPPSFSKIRMGVYDRSCKNVYGHAASGNLNGSGGTFFELVGKTSCPGKHRVKLYVEKSIGIPPEMNVGMVSVTSNKLKLITDTQTVAVNQAGDSKILVAVGTEAYLSKIYTKITSQLSLSVFGNNGAIFFKYALPFGTKALDLTLFDLKGRIVNAKQLTGSTMPQSGIITLNSTCSNGFYLAEIKAYGANSRPQILRRKVVYVR